jgi:hypothetical protein
MRTELITKLSLLWKFLHPSCALSALQCAGSDRMYAAPSLYAGLSPVTPAVAAAAADDDGSMDADDSAEQQQLQLQQHSSVVVTAPAQLQVSTTT